MVSSSSRSSFLLRLGLFELLFLTPLIFYGWATTFSSVKQTFAQLVCLVLACYFFIAISHKKLILSPPSFFSLLVIFFAFFSLISVLWSVSFYASLLGLGIWGVFFFIYFLTSVVVENEKWMVILLVATVTSGFIAAAYGLLQFYGFELPIWREVPGRMRLFSTFGNPNYLAGYLAAALHISALLFFMQRGKWKIVWIVIIAILYASLLMTHTRGVWVALFFSSLFVVILLAFYGNRFFKKNKISLVFLVVIMSAITLMYSTPNPLNRGRVDLIKRGVSVMDFRSTAGQRLLIWNSALELIKEKPFFGWGVGTFGIHYPEAQGAFLSRDENRNYLPRTNRSVHAHNDYLQIWAETGLVGLLLFFGILGTFYWTLFSFLKKRRGKDCNLFVIFFAGGITSFLIDATVSFPLYIIQNGMLFWFLIALAVGIMHGKIKRSEYKDEDILDKKENIKNNSYPFKILLRWLFLIVIFLGIFYLAYWRIKLFVADTHAKQAELLMEADLYTAARIELEKAISLNPHNAHAFANLARTYGYLGLYYESIEAADRAELNWNTPNIHNQRAFAYLQIGEMEAAKKALARCMYLYPNFAAAYINSGYINLLEAEQSMGERDLRRAEEKLHKSFLYYVQGKIWQPDLSLPDALSLAYHKYYRLQEAEMEMEDDKGGSIICGEVSPSFFLYAKKDYVMFALPFVRRAQEQFDELSVSILMYQKKETKIPAIAKLFSLELELRDKDRLVLKKEFLDVRIVPDTPCILGFKTKTEILPGSYTLLVSLVQAGSVVSSEKLSFDVHP